MNTFQVQLLATDRSDTVLEVVSFVGEDATGSFGLMAQHVRCMTMLTFGLARLTLADGRRLYAGLPGGLLYFVDNTLKISTRRYLLGDDPQAIASALAKEVLAEEQSLAQTRRKLHLLEANMLTRVGQLGAGKLPKGAHRLGGHRRRGRRRGGSVAQLGGELFGLELSERVGTQCPHPKLLGMLHVHVEIFPRTFKPFGLA